MECGLKQGRAQGQVLVQEPVMLLLRQRRLRVLMRVGALLVSSIVVFGGGGAVRASDPKVTSELSPSMATKPSAATSPSSSIDVRNQTVRAAVTTIVEQAGWDLVIATDSPALDRKLTARLKQRPMSEALEIILKDTGLRAELGDKLIVVSSIRPAGSAHAVSIRVQHDVDAARDAQDDLDSQQDDDEDANLRTNDERVYVGQSGRVEADEDVSEAVAVGGSLTVVGHVRGDAVAVGGSLTLEPGASVDGDAVAVGGELIVHPGATVHGDRVSVASSIGGIISKIVSAATGEGLDVPIWPWLGFGGSLLRALTMFVIGLLLMTLVPERIERIDGLLASRPGAAALAGVALMAGFLPFCLLLLVTLVGIPLIPVAVLALVTVLAMGMAALATRLGERIPLGGSKSKLACFALGVLLLTLIDLIPVVGTVLVLLAGFVSAGAVLLSRFGSLDESVAPM